MRIRAFTLIVFFVAFSFIFAEGQASAPKALPNPEIQRMIKEVSARNIEATIRKLVSFGTRHAL